MANTFSKLNAVECPYCMERFDYSNVYSELVDPFSDEHETECPYCVEVIYMKFSINIMVSATAESESEQDS